MLIQTFNKVNKALKSLNKKKHTSKEIELLSIELRNIFLKSNMPYDYVNFLISDMNKKFAQIDNKDFDKKVIICNYLKQFFKRTFSSVNNSFLRIKKDNTTIIGIFGTSGSGKTSFTAKLANFLQKKYNKKVLCLSFNTIMISEQEKLKNLCKNNCIDYINSIELGLEKTIQKIREIIKYKIVDIIIVDDANLINNCNYFSIKDFDERIFVVDSMYGQNAISLIENQNCMIDITGFAVTKIDGSQNVGIFFSIITSCKKPIYYISSGEDIFSIYEFNDKIIDNLMFKESYLKQIITACSYKVKKKKRKKSLKYNKKTTKLNYNDLREQLLNMINIKKTPDKTIFFVGLRPFNVKFDNSAYILIKKWLSIISSMTELERLNLNSFESSRLNRIAGGAGVKIEDVLTLQTKIEEINKKLL